MMKINLINSKLNRIKKKKKKKKKSNNKIYRLTIGQFNIVYGPLRNMWWWIIINTNSPQYWSFYPIRVLSILILFAFFLILYI